MTKTQSTMIALGTKIPYFRLPNVVSGELVSSDNFTDKKAILIMFICNHCPYVRHVQEEIAQVGTDYADKPLGIVAICSNDVESYPDDSPENLKKQAQNFGFNFPYLFDETQAVAKAFTAACTPDFFLFNEKRELAYRGQLDESRPGNDSPVSGKDLRRAIDAVLADKNVRGKQKPSAGCNVKWKTGNEPAYFA